MEKNQHNNDQETNAPKSGPELTGNQPGQQLPQGADDAAFNEQSQPGTKEQHSESSMPQQEGETLGTP